MATFSEMTPPLPIISLLVGIAILFFGRRLFWLFVAAVGFAAGMELTPYLMQHPPVWLAIVLSLALGIIGALLAFLLQKIAIAIAGFLVGGRAAVAIVAAVMVNHGQYNGITFVIGGIIGAILLLLLFDWALIIFSAIAGAELITTNIHIPPTGGTILLLLLAIFGIVVQSAMLRRRRALA